MTPTTARLEPPASGPHVVAVGGGHGLSATLSALRRLSDNITAVVGVADDGGSSGRLRAEFGIPPPGDLRMALAALCPDDAYGRAWQKVLQHRYSGDGPLGGHAVGNLLISALWEQTSDVVSGLDYLAVLVGARGRVLPVSTQPLELVAEVVTETVTTPEVVRGQANVARRGGRVVDLRLEPSDAQGCPQALSALRDAQVVILGPGSWFTSVLPHLEMADIRAQIAASQALRILVMNLESSTAETTGFTPADHLEVIASRYPDVSFDVVLADPRAVPDPAALAAGAQALGAEVRYERLAAPALAESLPAAAHSADLLAAAFSAVFERGRISPWR